MVLVQLLILVPRTYHTYLYFMYGYNCSIGPMIRTCLQLAAQADKPINRLLVTTEYCSLACLPVYYSSCTWYYGSIAVAVLLSAICGYTRQPGKRGMIRIQYVRVLPLRTVCTSTKNVSPTYPSPSAAGDVSEYFSTNQ